MDIIISKSTTPPTRPGQSLDTAHKFGRRLVARDCALERLSQSQQLGLRATTGGALAQVQTRRHLRLRDVWAIRQGLFEAAHSAGGTSASVFGNFPIPVAGKTGTAQTPYGSDHSWYASWAPAANPRVVVVVLIEHGGFGVQAAAPAAKEIYSAFFHVGKRGG